MAPEWSFPVEADKVQSNPMKLVIKANPEAIIDGYIDAGELVTQYLSLALNPYPHAEGVKYELGDDNEEAIKPKLDNPFAALKEWKNNKKEN